MRLLNILLTGEQEHVIYIFASLSVVALVLYLGSLIKNQKWKDCYLALWALICFGFHISTCFISLFQEPSKGYIGQIVDNQLLPIYFCNFIMYLQLVAAFWFDKKTKLFQNFATFTAWGGIFGALITLFVNEPGFSNWSVLQSALSHSCLLITSAYLFVGKYVKINVYNVIPFSFGVVASGIVGGLVELIYWANGLGPRNAMYLIKGPSEAPEMHGGLFALAMLALIFVFGVIWEFIFKKDKNTRWYKSIEDINMYLPIRKKEKEIVEEKVSE